MMDTVDSGQIEKVFHPRKFIIYLLIISSLMAFAGLTSAYLVMKADSSKVWQVFELPSLFKASTLVVFISSITIHFAYQAAKKSNLQLSKILVSVTFVLGCLFAYLQYKALFVQLFGDGVWFLGAQSTASSTLTYTMPLFHLFHLAIAMIVLIILLIKSFNETVFDRNIITFHNSVVFWHFLGILWVYLYLFLYFS